MHKPTTRRNCALPQRRQARAREQHPRRRREVGPHEQREREQHAGADGSEETIGRPGTAASHQQHEAGQQEDGGGRIGKAARRPLDVLHQARAEQHAHGNGGEHERERQRPRERQEAPEHGEDQERQHENEREIAEIALAEEEVLGGAQVAQAGREIEHFLAALERAGDVAGEELPQHPARHAVVDQAVVAAVERAHAAEEARIVEGNDGERDRDERKRQHQAPWANPHKQAEHGDGGDERPARAPPIGAARCLRSGRAASPAAA